MRYYILLLLLLPITVPAQQKRTWHLAFNTGVIMNQIDFPNNTGSAALTYNSGNASIWLGLKSWAELKHLQLGLAVENGLVNENIEYNAMVYNENNQLLDQFTIYTSYNIFSPAVSPMAFAHYRLDLPRRAYIYGGPALGAIIGRSGLSDTNTTTKAALAFGANLGISFAISKHARFEIAHAYRAARIKQNSGRDEVLRHDGTTAYAVYTIPAFWLQYTTNSIGIVIDF